MSSALLIVERRPLIPISLARRSRLCLLQPSYGPLLPLHGFLLVGDLAAQFFCRPGGQHRVPSRQHLSLLELGVITGGPDPSPLTVGTVHPTR